MDARRGVGLSSNTGIGGPGGRGFKLGPKNSGHVLCMAPITLMNHYCILTNWMIVRLFLTAIGGLVSGHSAVTK